MSDPIEIRTDDEAADIVATNFGSKELRKLASNAGVSRERGDTKRATAEKIVAQDPALAARIIDNSREVDMDASEFREAREVGAGSISLEDAIKRARHKKMFYKLKSLKNSTDALTSHEVEVDWEYGGQVRDGSSSLDRGSGYDPGFTSITVKKRDDVDMHWALDARASIHLTPHGRCTHLTADESEYIDRNTAEPGKQWRLGLSRIEGFWTADEDDE